jgi:hypothetical protein
MTGSFTTKLNFVNSIFVANYSEEFEHGQSKAPIMAYLSAGGERVSRYRLIERELWHKRPVCPQVPARLDE